MRIFFSVGEPSGDLHGANLIRELRIHEPDVECVGFGGPKMAAAGCHLLDDLTQFAVMWFLHVLLNLHRFFALWRQADRYLAEHDVDAMVLIDYPGFNWWMARSAKKHGIPVFYYGVPQMWGWAGWRVKKMRRLVDHVLCKLPFEVDWYRSRGCHATYVGHPYFDEVRQRHLDAGYVAQMRTGGRLVAILPGSRTQEVRCNLPWFLKAAERIGRELGDVRFAIASFNERQAVIAREMIRDLNVPVEVHVAKTPELIEAADCCLACSGSVSLELLYHEKATVILYWISPLALWAQRYFRTVKYITLVNLLATNELFPRRVTLYDPDAPGAEPVPYPEYLTCEDKSVPMAAHIIRWLTQPDEVHRRIAQLRQIKNQFAQPGASATAARYILAAVRGTQQPPASGSNRLGLPHAA